MSLWQDIRYGARTLRNSPGFTLTAVVTMALGIGATTATFSVCDAMLWKPLPLPHLDQLVIVLQRFPDDPNDWVSNTPADAVNFWWGCKCACSSPLARSRCYWKRRSEGWGLVARFDGSCGQA